MVANIKQEVKAAEEAGDRLITIFGRSRRFASAAQDAEFDGLATEHNGGSIGAGVVEMRKTLGNAAGASVVAGIETDLLVVQAAQRKYD